MFILNPNGLTLDSKDGLDCLARLPRRQQQKIIDVVEALVAQQANGHSKAA